MKVNKERQIAPKTPTYSVEDHDGHDYLVIVLDNEAHCVMHGLTCEHAKAVEAERAK